MKISACLIIRNEAATLERCLASIRPHVDELCVLDTGSVDDSPRIAKKYADKWEQWTGCNDSEGRIADFSAARNRNLAMATGDAVWWQDGDDEVIGGEHLRKLAREAPRGPSGAFSVLAAYEYDHDAAGRVVTLQWRERLVGPPAQFEWRGPVHEGLLGRAGCELEHMQTELVRVVHRRRASGKPTDPERNLRILRAWYAKHGEGDARLLHYFGAELLMNHHIGEAMHCFRRHAALSGWSDERCLSLLHLARIHLSIGDGTEAARYATDAMTTKAWPEPMWVMGQAYCMLSEQGFDAEYNLRRGNDFLTRGMQLAAAPVSPTLLMVDPTARATAASWLSTARAKLGDVDGAIQHAEACLAEQPERADVRENLTTLSAERARNQVRGGMVKLHELGKVPREAGAMVEAVLRGDFKVEREPRETLLSNRALAAAVEGAKLGKLPAGAQLFGDVEGVKRDLEFSIAPGPRDVITERLSGLRLPDSGKLRIAFYLGHQLEPWTPEMLERDGMGGSETMAWEMSKRLAKLGHNVSVYGHVPLDVLRTYEGVKWYDAEAFPRTCDCDVLIVSRQAAAVELPHSAKVRVLWVHDVHVGESFTPHLAAKYDLIWCLSKWHREFFLSVYPWCPPKKVEVTRNGIDPERFTRSVSGEVRNPHRAIYSSSPDRGLAEAVRAWPAVRKLVPDAELHCYYGFDNWDRSLELMGAGDHPHPRCNRAARDEVKRLVANTEGVIMHGRVNQHELAAAMLGAGVWFYPTWFSETSCITAMEAQAAGLWCVCPPLAALAETVHFTVRNWSASGVVSDMVKAMRDSSERLYPDLERISLDTLAESWQARLNNLVAEVVPPFSEAAQ